jgi:hypothetical protein
MLYGSSWSKPNVTNPNGPDTPWDLDSNAPAIGYQVFLNDPNNPPGSKNNPGLYSWHLGPGQADNPPHFMFDMPEFALFKQVEPDGKTQSTITSMGVNGEAYTTYLMYIPDVQGIWVALSRVYWTWSEQTSAANGWQVQNISGPSPSVGSAVGSWPQWSGLGSSIVWVKQQ